MQPFSSIIPTLLRITQPWHTKPWPLITVAIALNFVLAALITSVLALLLTSFLVLLFGCVVAFVLALAAAWCWHTYRKCVRLLWVVVERLGECEVVRREMERRGEKPWKRPRGRFVSGWGDEG